MHPPEIILTLLHRTWMAGQTTEFFISTHFLQLPDCQVVPIRKPVIIIPMQMVTMAAAYMMIALVNAVDPQSWIVMASAEVMHTKTVVVCVTMIPVMTMKIWTIVAFVAVITVVMAVRTPTPLTTIRQPPWTMDLVTTLPNNLQNSNLTNPPNKLFILLLMPPWTMLPSRRKLTGLVHLTEISVSERWHGMENILPFSPWAMMDMRILPDT